MYKIYVVAKQQQTCSSESLESEVKRHAWLLASPAPNPITLEVGILTHEMFGAHKYGDVVRLSQAANRGLGAF